MVREAELAFLQAGAAVFKRQPHEALPQNPTWASVGILSPHLVSQFGGKARELLVLGKVTILSQRRFQGVTGYYPFFKVQLGGLKSLVVLENCNFREGK